MVDVFLGNTVYVVFCFLFGCQYQCDQLPGKTRLWNDLLCVEWMLNPAHSLGHWLLYLWWTFDVFCWQFSYNGDLSPCVQLFVCEAESRWKHNAVDALLQAPDLTRHLDIQRRRQTVNVHSIHRPTVRSIEYLEASYCDYILHDTLAVLALWSFHKESFVWALICTCHCQWRKSSFF